MDYFSKYYIKPWCRMGPYIIGIMFGYLLYKTKGKLRIHKVRKNIFFFKMKTKNENKMPQQSHAVGRDKMVLKPKLGYKKCIVSLAY